jgi:O-antigen ligase
MLRVTIARNPFEGAGPGMSFGACVLAAYALLTLVSQAWSHAPARALVEFDLALVYLLALVLFGSLGHSRERLVWLLRVLAVTIVVICACGLITRLLPHVWPTTPDIANRRLSFPLTYWNALGVFGAFGVVLCLHLASDIREAPLTRVLAAIAIPIVATTIYFTFSRGGIAAAVLGVIVYALIARPKGLLSTAVAAVPTTAVALKVAYDANLLATPDPTTAAAVVQGKHVAIAVIGCAAVAGLIRGLLAIALDPRLERFTLARRSQVLSRRIGWSTLAALIVALVIAFNGALAHEYHRFVNPAPVGNASDLRARLTDPGNNGRLDLWRVGWHQFERKPLLGHGAGTFANTWAQYRIDSDFVLDAHSLYIETLDELGLVGFLLLVGVIVLVLVRTAARARGPDRPLYAAALAVMLLWALHAGIDWDWEMPVVTLPFFALGGFMLARRIEAPASAPVEGSLAPRRWITPYARTLVGLGCLLLAVAPAYVWLSQLRLDQATAAFAQGDCRAATRSAISSISILGNRPDPYEVISYCDIRRDMPQLAIATIQKAISLDPNNWNFRYDLAVMRASAGLNPMAAIRKAISLDPRESLVQDALHAFAAGGPIQWQRAGKAIADQFTTL